MKRDKELYRAILLYINNHKQATVNEIALNDQYSLEQIAYHIGLLIEDGCLSGIDVTGTSQKYPEWLNIKLTSRGHDYVDIIEDENSWASIKKQKREKTIQLLINGDFVAGDKIEDDKIEGNKITSDQSNL